MADDAKKPECPGGDALLLGPEMGGNGMRPFVRHHKDHRVETGFGVATPAVDGKPPPDGSVFITSREGTPYFDVHEIPSSTPKSAAPTATSRGPAQVCTPAYGKNYDTIFGTKAPMGQA